MSAHDPVRYTSDILAWIHQALASEKEFLEALFGDEPPTPAQIEALQSVSSLYTNADLLASIFEGLCRGIKSRIEQSFVVHPGNIEILFKIYQVLQFYSTLISPLFKGSAAQLASPTSTSISSSSSLASTSTSSSSSTSTSIPSTSSSSPALLLSLKELESSCKTHFLDALRKQGERLIKTPMKPAQDLQPTPLMLEMTQNLVSAQDNIERRPNKEKVVRALPCGDFLSWFPFTLFSFQSVLNFLFICVECIVVSTIIHFSI